MTDASYRDLGPEDAWSKPPPPVHEIVATSKVVRFSLDKASITAGKQSEAICECHHEAPRHVDDGTGRRADCHDCLCVLYRPDLLEIT